MRLQFIWRHFRLIMLLGLNEYLHSISPLNIYSVDMSGYAKAYRASIAKEIEKDSCEIRELEVDFLRAQDHSQDAPLQRSSERIAVELKHGECVCECLLYMQIKKRNNEASLLSMVEDELNFFYVGVGSRSKLPRFAQVLRYYCRLTVIGNDTVLIHSLFSFLIANLRSFH